MPNKGFFKSGNKFGQGRPPKSKSQIEPIRRRILMVVKRRIMHEKDLESVPTVDLLKFLASIMPKEGLATQAQVINYVSNVPRSDTENPLVLPRKASPQIEENISEATAPIVDVSLSTPLLPNEGVPLEEKPDEPEPSPNENL